MQLNLGDACHESTAVRFDADQEAIVIYPPQAGCGKLPGIHEEYVTEGVVRCLRGWVVSFVFSS